MRPGPRAPSSAVDLPFGLAIEFDRDTKQLRPDLLFGGSPGRALRLSDSGVAALAELRKGRIQTAAGSRLARRLTDAGLAHPRPAPAVELDVTVVIPVYGRAESLGRCLAAIGREHPVLVVDDASPDPAAIARVAGRHGAELLRRGANGGPGAARNTALPHVRTELVAFVDSDCAPPPGWLAALAGHFADPLVVAAAPRIVPESESAYARARSALDLGVRPGRVAPMTRLAYVPTAALLMRSAAAGAGFDEALRYGEDVDLIWRLVAAGWRIRYDPSVEVAHAEPDSMRRLLARRFHYGTSAAPLTARHPGQVTPLVLQPWPTLAVAAALARRPLAAAAAVTAGTALLARRLRTHDIPTAGIGPAMANAVGQTALGIGRWSTQFAAVPLVAAAVRSRRWRGPAAALLLGPPLVEWVRARPALDPVRYTAARVADELAYGAGVYAGCFRERDLRAVRPDGSSWRPRRWPPRAQDADSIRPRR